MRNVLITSMLALSVGCGAAMAQTQQSTDAASGSDTGCASGAANCQSGSGGEQAQGKASGSTDQQAQGKSKVQTDEQAQGKASSTDKQAQDKSKMKTDDQAQGSTSGSTDQQAQDKSKVKTDEQAQGKASSTDKQAQDKSKTKTDDQAQGSTSGSTDQQAQGKTSEQDKSSTGSINNVTVEQKTEITQVIKEQKVEPISHVDFDISVGVEVPRHKVRLHRLPARIVKIVPAYESYEYFLLSDGRIVIVEPDTLKIVVILS